MDTTRSERLPCADTELTSDCLHALATAGRKEDAQRRLLDEPWRERTFRTYATGLPSGQ
jgi:hypothetical protein